MQPTGPNQHDIQNFVYPVDAGGSLPPQPTPEVNPAESPADPNSAAARAAAARAIIHAVHDENEAAARAGQQPTQQQ